MSQTNPSPLQQPHDFATSVYSQLGRYERTFHLVPQNLLVSQFSLPNLQWSSVQFGSEGLDQVPSDRRGIYAFVLQGASDSLPPHGYVLYVGIAGKRSNRSLRQRYSDYLNATTVMKRPRIAVMIGNWHQVLRFFFAAVDEDVTSEQLETMERELNTALIPPYSEVDIDATVRTSRRAFQ